MKKQKNRRGFTLLEMLVVMVVMVILSSVVAVSYWPALSEARLRAGSRIILSALRYARSYAVSHRTEAGILFDSERRGLSVVTPATDEESTGGATSMGSTSAEGEEDWRTVTTPAGGYQRLPMGVGIKEISRGDTVDEGADGTLVTFTAVGRGEDVRITLQDSRGGVQIIQVNEVTGQCEFVSEADE